MEVRVEVSDEEGSHRAYVGMEVCRGPGVIRMVLTRPYRLAGRTVSLPLDRVESVAEVASATLGEPVQTVEATGPATGERDDDHQGNGNRR